MRNIIYFFPLLILLIISSCGDKKTGIKEQKPAIAQKTTAPVVTPNALPSITLEEMKTLYEKCNYIDFIFYNMDFSMSVQDKNNVQRVVTFVDKTQPSGNLTCKAMGRIIYQASGEILMEADMHFDKTCRHLVFYKDGKKVAANNMTDQGVAYFNQMFSKVKVSPTPQ